MNRRSPRRLRCFPSLRAQLVVLSKMRSKCRYNSRMTSAPVKATISHALLQQVDIRVGTILAVGDVPQSKKLAKLNVDFGDHSRVILAGLKQERSDLSSLIGKQALFVVNLEPRQMAGEISEGMLFDLGYDDGIRPVLAVPEEKVPNGTRAG